MRGTYTKRIQKLSDRLSDPALAEHARTIKNNKKQYFFSTKKNAFKRYPNLLSFQKRSYYSFRT